MITRFRIEANGESHDDVHEQLQVMSVGVMTTATELGLVPDHGNWIRTADVTSIKENRYIGRMVWLLTSMDTDKSSKGV